ncbi:MAG: hypothetical protein ACI9Y1_002857 [Lentisphaeria bacterium]|jgi:hypothetical protein
MVPEGWKRATLNEMATTVTSCSFAAKYKPYLPSEEELKLAQKKEKVLERALVQPRINEENPDV